MFLIFEGDLYDFTFGQHKGRTQGSIGRYEIRRSPAQCYGQIHRQDRDRDHYGRGLDHQQHRSSADQAIYQLGLKQFA